MSYNKLILKTNASIEIENVISYYAIKDVILARQIEKEIRLGFKTIAKNPKVSTVVILKSEYFG